jgi:hypothetical protein
MVTHENDRSGSEIRTYFLEKNMFEYLLKPPSAIVEAHIPNSKTNLRKTGHSMSSERMKELGELYLNRWLLRSRGEDSSGKVLTNLDMIRSVALLQELQNYNRTGNFDRVMALMGGVIQMRQLEANIALEVKTAAKTMEFFEKQLINFKERTAKSSISEHVNGMSDSRLQFLR